MRARPPVVQPEARLTPARVGADNITPTWSALGLERCVNFFTACCSSPCLCQHSRRTRSFRAWQVSIAPLPAPTGLVPRSGAKTVLTSSSPTACTSLSATAGTLVSIINTGAATTVFFALYDEAASPTCAAADLIYGDGTTLTLLAGQVITLGIPLANGLSYQISGALSGNLIVVRN